MTNLIIPALRSLYSHEKPKAGDFYFEGNTWNPILSSVHVDHAKTKGFPVITIRPTIVNSTELK